MWVLLLLFMKANGTIIAYDQGRFERWRDCRDTGVAMVSELDGVYRSTCVEWKEKK